MFQLKVLEHQTALFWMQETQEATNVSLSPVGGPITAPAVGKSALACAKVIQFPTLSTFPTTHPAATVQPGQELYGAVRLVTRPETEFAAPPGRDWK